VFVTAAMDDEFARVGKGVGPGIALDYNWYAGPGQWNEDTNDIDWTAWKAAQPTWGMHSMVGDPGLGDLSEFSQTTAHALGVDGLEPGEVHDRALGAAADGAGQVQVGADPAAAGEREA